MMPFVKLLLAGVKSARTHLTVIMDDFMPFMCSTWQEKNLRLNNGGAKVSGVYQDFNRWPLLVVPPRYGRD
jgi:hypothetical protein